MTGSFFAAVDGGGTKTAVVVVDATGQQAARVLAPTSNAAVVGHERAAETLRSSIMAAMDQAGTEPPLAGLWCGLSGSDRPEDEALLRPAISDLARHLHMSNDAELALGALPDQIGIVVVAGTGSICFGRNAEDQTVRAGGWGHIFSDEGSGWGVATDGLRAYANAVDGVSRPTGLVEAFKAHFNITDPFTVINRVYAPDMTKGDIADLARIVMATATDGDDVALSVLRHHAVALSACVAAVARRLAFTGAVDLALVGGLLRHNDIYRRLTIDAINERVAPGAIEIVDDPALAAARSLAIANQEIPR